MLQSQFKWIIHTNSFAWTNAFSACEVFHVERYFFRRFRIPCKMSIICGCRYYCGVCLLFDVVSLRTCTQKMLSIKFTRMKYEFKFIKRIFNFREAERLNETKKKVVSRKCFTFISVAYLDNWHFYHQFHACNKLATKFSDLKSQNNHKWTVCQHECELDMFSFLWLPLDKTHLP